MWGHFGYLSHLICQSVPLPYCPCSRVWLITPMDHTGPNVTSCEQLWRTEDVIKSKAKQRKKCMCTVYPERLKLQLLVTESELNSHLTLGCIIITLHICLYIWAVHISTDMYSCWLSSWWQLMHVGCFSCRSNVVTCRLLPSLKLFVKCRPKLIVRPISLQWGHQSNIEF